MRIISALGIVLFGVIFAIVIDDVKGASFDAGFLTKANTFVTNGADLLTKIGEFIPPTKVFAKITEFIDGLAPIIVSVSSIISSVLMFFPKDDKPELKAINAGFNTVNYKLDTISSQLGNLQTVIELTGAKAAFTDSFTAINSNYDSLTHARKTNDKQSLQFFAKKYEDTFSLATEKIYDILIGGFGDFGFDMVNLYRMHVKCNAVLTSQFCAKGLQIVVKGMEIEGAYMGYKNNTKGVTAAAETWKTKMAALTKHCKTKIADCETNWKIYAQQQFRDTFKEIGGDNTAFAKRLAEDMKTIVPHRSWLSIVYDQIPRQGQHAFNSKYEVDTLWNANGHCAAVISTPKEAALTGQPRNDFSDLILKQKVAVQAVNDCKYRHHFLLSGEKYWGKHADSIVEIVRKNYSAGAVYVVQMDYHLGVVATGSTLYVTDVQWPCQKDPFKVIIFQ